MRRDRGVLGRRAERPHDLDDVARVGAAIAQLRRVVALREVAGRTQGVEELGRWHLGWVLGGAEAGDVVQEETRRHVVAVLDALALKLVKVELGDGVGHARADVALVEGAAVVDLVVEGGLEDAELRREGAGAYGHLRHVDFLVPGIGLVKDRAGEEVVGELVVRYFAEWCNWIRW